MGFSNFDGSDFMFGAPPPGPLEAQLALWAHEAAASGRVACVYLTASWCPPSVLLEKSLSNPLMAHALRGVNFATYDIDDATNELKELGFPAHTVPVFFILDRDGRKAGPTITGGAWGENTPENMAPPLERFFDAARAEVAARGPVVSMPDPKLIGEMVADASARAAVAPGPQPAMPITTGAGRSSARWLLVAGAIVLVVLAAVYFAKWRQANAQLDQLEALQK